MRLVVQNGRGRRPREAELQEGKTWENDFVRVHRFRSAYHVWDLTNAGRRGKKVRKIALYDTDMVRNESVQKNLDKLAKGIDKVKNFDSVVKWFDIIVRDAKLRGEHSPKIQVSEERGVDVAPGGFKPIRVVGKGVRVDSDYDSFTIKNLDDKINEPTCIPAIRGGKKDIKVFYRWVKENQAEIKNMTFSDVLKAMKKIGVSYHQYCAMD